MFWRAGRRTRRPCSGGLVLRLRPMRFLLGAIGRLSKPKGFDLLAENLSTIVGEGMQLAVLGSPGDRSLQYRYQAAAQANPGRVSVTIGNDEGLAHLISRRRGCARDSITRRAMRSGAALCFALWRGSHRVEGRRTGRYGRRRLRSGRQGRQTNRIQIRTGNRQESRRCPPQAGTTFRDRRCLAADSAQRHVDRRLLALSGELLRRRSLQEFGRSFPNESCLRLPLPKLATPPAWFAPAIGFARMRVTVLSSVISHSDDPSRAHQRKLEQMVNATYVRSASVISCGGTLVEIFVPAAT